MNRLKTSLFSLSSILVFIFAVSVSMQQASARDGDLASEQARYKQILAGNNFQQKRRILEKLGWSGQTSTELYDLIESSLLALKAANDKTSVQQASWFAKALGYSGNQKYRATLKNIANNAKSKKVKKYGQQGLDNLALYQRWNPIISAGLESAPKDRLEETRVTNMLAAQDHELMRMGAKRVYYGHKNDGDLIAKAAERLTSEYKLADKSNDAQIDGLAWLIKVMAESGESRYRPLLLEISNQAKVKKLKKYAKKYAEYL